MSAEYRGNPCQETARAPTIMYSTWFAFKHSTNSRKSLVSGIGTRPFLDCEEYVHSLLRGHLASGESIRSIGLFKAVEYANGLFHTLYFTARLPVDIIGLVLTNRQDADELQMDGDLKWEKNGDRQIWPLA